MRNSKVFAVLGTLMMLVACTDSSEPAGSERQVLDVQVSGEPEETAVYRAIAAAYERDFPDASRINLIEIADKDDHLARLSTAFAGGEPPDVFLVNYREYAQFVSLGAVEAVGDRLDLDLDDYFPQPLEAFTFEGEVQCMPQNVSSLVVYYNRALFKEGGLSHPRPDWTWDDFREYALELTRGEVRGLGVEPNVIRLAPFVWSNGGEVTDDPDTPTRFVLDEPKAREALEFIVSLVRDDKVVPTEPELAAQDLEQRFVSGKLGMLLSSRRDTPAFREVQGLDWDVAGLPVAPGGEPAGILHSDAYCIAAGSDSIEAALDYVAYATGEKGETIGALGGRTVPSLKSIANSPAFLDPTQPPRHARVFLDGVPFIRRIPVIATWPEIEEVSEEILIRAFYEPGYSIDDALRDLDDATRSLFAEASG